MAYKTGFKNSLVQVRMCRDPQPDARVREAAAITAHPQAGNGGTVPGLEQGSLRPLPEAVALLCTVAFNSWPERVSGRPYVPVGAGGWCGLG
ncbi:hypothetical protein [Streptomyces vinaceus]|uniref:hypothetical protein n=1 Tax=Streptomyces vinaceus TaxID=1960 RepID=UPI00381AE43A